MRTQIDYFALDHNISYLKSLAPDMIPVLKGNCYGHGQKVATYISRFFDIIAVGTIDEALVHKNSSIIILNGINDFDKIKDSYIPVLNTRQVENDKFKRFAIFTDSGCKRINVSNNARFKRKPEYAIYHSGYKNSENYDSQYFNGYDSHKISFGTSISILNQKKTINPRIGLALFGYSSDDESNSKLKIVKSIYASISDRIYSRTLGYSRTAIETQKYVYSIDCGYYNSLYESLYPIKLHCTTEPNANIRLLVGDGLISMCQSFIDSDIELEYDAEIELLGVNVKANLIAKQVSTSTANILRLS